MTVADKVFAGSIPAIYESHMVPITFLGYAADMARRVAAARPVDVLEIAAGTGAVAAELVKQLPRDSTITATDLNQAMLDVAMAKLPSGKVHFRACDAMQLPFPPQSFDAVVCQFGAMFFPDKLTAYREARRVLRGGGRFLLSVWGDLASNPLTNVVNEALARAFPTDPPAFFRRAPFGYHDVPAISSTLREAGFSGVSADAVTKTSRAPSAEFAAIALCQGTPMRAEIERRAPGRLAEITALAARALAREFGEGPVDSNMRAIVFEAHA
ncbi:class I SAM-dependent methyltransferase [Aestuariivirga sp.]|uniref:class I SAM-dependent methyltransferase n=1 Tax=Aestuariivirga sp. TaxID=2650926 RepID=UPI003918AE0F